MIHENVYKGTQYLLKILISPRLESIQQLRRMLLHPGNWCNVYA